MDEVYTVYKYVSRNHFIPQTLDEVNLSRNQAPKETDLSLTFDSYVFSRLAVLQERAQNRTRLSMGDIHTYLFINLTDTLVELITFAERSPNSNASRNLITKADQFQDALERVCQRWTDNTHTVTSPSGSKSAASIWHHHSRQPRWFATEGHLQQPGFQSDHLNWTGIDGNVPATRAINLREIMNGTMPWGTMGPPAGGRAPGTALPVGPPTGPPAVEDTSETPGRNQGGRNQDGGRSSMTGWNWRGTGTRPRGSDSSDWRRRDGDSQSSGAASQSGYRPPR